MLFISTKIKHFQLVLQCVCVGGNLSPTLYLTTKG